MGLFSDLKNRVLGMPTKSEVRQTLAQLRTSIANLYSSADKTDRECGTNFGYLIRLDLLMFSLHIANSDDRLDAREVEAINYLLLADFSYEECKRILDKNADGIRYYTSNVPTTFEEIASSPDIPSDFLRMFVVVYAGIGTVISASDGEISKSEEQDILDFTDMLTKRINNRR